MEVPDCGDKVQDRLVYSNSIPVEIGHSKPVGPLKYTQIYFFSLKMCLGFTTLCFYIPGLFKEVALLCVVLF